MGEIKVRYTGDLRLALAVPLGYRALQQVRAGARARVNLQQVGGHGHLAARDVRAHLLANATEGEVAHGRKRREVELAWFGLGLGSGLG